MSKRIVASFLWLAALANLGPWISALTGLPALLGLALGVVAAVFFAVDPLGVIWPRPAAIVELPGALEDPVEYAEAA